MFSRQAEKQQEKTKNTKDTICKSVNADGGAVQQQVAAAKDGADQAGGVVTAGDRAGLQQQERQQQQQQLAAVGEDDERNEGGWTADGGAELQRCAATAEGAKQEDGDSDDRARQQQVAPAGAEAAGVLPRAAAVVIRGGELLMVQHKLQEGGVLWAFPGGAVREADSGASDAALRELHGEVGVTEEQLRSRTSTMRTMRGAKTQFFIFEVRGWLPQKECDEAWRHRSAGVQERVLQWQWVPMAEVEEAGCRGEDFELVQELQAGVHNAVAHEGGRWSATYGAAVRGWAWFHRISVGAAAEAVRLLKAEDRDRWAAQARKNERAVRRWCGLAAVGQQAMRDDPMCVRQGGGRTWARPRALEAVLDDDCEAVVVGDPVVWARLHSSKKWWCLDATAWGGDSTTVALSVARDLAVNGSKVQVGDEVAMQLRVLGRRWSGQATVVEQASPSIVLGSNCWEQLESQGLSRVLAPEDTHRVERGEGRVVDGRVEFGEVEDLLFEDEEQRDQWREYEQALWEMKRVEALGSSLAEDCEGHETGGLEGGHELAMMGRLLESVTPELRGLLADAQQRLADGLPSGPDFSEPPDCNPPEFKNKKQEFVPGAIHMEKHRQAWHALRPEPPKEVLRWVDNMYEIKVEEGGRGIRKQNGKVARMNSADLAKVMFALLEQGSWEVVQEGSTVNVIPLNLAPKPSASPPWRLIVNAIELNKHAVGKWPVKYEGLYTLPMVVDEGQFGFSLDLKDGYYGVFLQEASRGLCGAQLEFEQAQVDRLQELGCLEGIEVKVLQSGKVRLSVQPKGLPMGYTLSCAIFTRLVRAITAKWRAKGYAMVNLLDDFAFFGTYAKCIEMRDAVLADLEALGLFVSWKKSVLVPTRRFKFLGFIVDLEAMRLFVPGDKLEQVEDLARQILTGEGVESCRQLLRLVGKVVSFGAAIPPVRYLTRETYRIIRPKEGDYDTAVPITPRVMQEMRQMVAQLRVWNQVGAPIRRSLQAAELRLQIDAGSGFGYRVDGVDRAVEWGDYSRAVAGDWTPEEAEMWQVHKELWSVHRMLEVDGDAIVGRTLVVWTDCRGVLRYLRVGMGGSDVLTDMAKKIWWRCVELGIRLTVEWVPGSQMVTAGVDGLSRFHEFKVAPRVFRRFHTSKWWGKRGGYKGYSMDLCSSEATRQGGLPFCQRGGGGESMGDARTVGLTPEVNYWVVPPVPLIDQTLLRLQEAKVMATVVVPAWKRQPYYAWLQRHGVAVERLEWTDWPATLLDVSEAKAKPHVTNRWQFMAVALDFREAGQHHCHRGRPVANTDSGPTGVWALEIERPRKRPCVEGDARRRLAAWEGVATKVVELEKGPPVGVELESEQQELPRAVAAVQQPKGFRVLSLCDGCSAVAMAWQDIQQRLGLHHVRLEVVAIEIDEWARGVAKKLGVVQSEHDDVERLADDSEGRRMVLGMGHFDMVACGFPCQDVSSARRGGPELGGDKTSLVYKCERIFRWVQEASPGVLRLFECAVSKKRRHVLDQLDALLAVKHVVLDGRALAAAQRRRQWWLNFEPISGVGQFADARVCSWKVATRDQGLATAWQAVAPWAPSPHDVLERDSGRRPAPIWEAKLPTIMACGPRSWNMGEVVLDHGRLGPLTVEEAERAMGMRTGVTMTTWDGTRVPEQQRWSLVGNSFCVPVVVHLLMSALLVKGFITRNDVRLQGAISFTICKDGPWQEAVQEALDAMAGLQRQQDLLVTAHTHGAGVAPGVGAIVVAAAAPQAVRPAMQAPTGSQPGRRPAKFRRVLNDKQMLQGVRRQSPADMLWEGAGGVPKLKILTRDQGRDPHQWRGRLAGQFSSVALMRDFVILSLADNTWKMYQGWWEVFEQWCEVDGHPVGQSGITQLQLMFESSVGGLATEYAPGTMEVYVAAVCHRFRMHGWGDPTEGTLIREGLRGARRWWGKDVEKKRPVEAEHLRHLLGMQLPAGWQMQVWRFSVALMCLMWLCGLRPKEARFLSGCDVRWSAEGAAVAVNRTKNDQEGFKRKSTLEWGESRQLCVLRFVHGYAVEHGLLQPKLQCSSKAHPTLECRACPRFFQNILASGVVNNAVFQEGGQPGMPKDRPCRVVKAIFTALAEDGLVAHEDVAFYSARSCRAGAVSAAAAAGVRRQVAAEQFRMQSERTLSHYDRMLREEKGVVSRAMQRMVDGTPQLS